MSERRRVSLLRVALACVLGIAAALLVACGSSGGKLIPVADAGPLQSDFETIAQDAQAGNGSCTATEAAILKTQQDFSELPASVDSGLRQTLRQGIENLRARALVLCAQPLAQTTPTNTTPKTTTTSTTTTNTSSTPTTSTPTTTTPTTSTPTTSTPTTSVPGGGTPAPGETPGGAGAPSGGQGGGTGVGASEGGPNPGEGPGGQEGAR